MDQKFTLEHQAQIRELWQEQQTYTYRPSKGETKPSWTIDTPPPTVSGSLHLGHIFSYTHTDLIARYKRMNGFEVFYPFGFDDNGLPTERFVEKKEGTNAHKIGRSAFIDLCLKTTHEVEKQFTELWKTLGLSADWNYTYSTISEHTRRISQESFLRLLQQGHIYRKQEPALYCPTCRTSVAQAELDDSEQASFFNTIPFIDAEGKEYLIATTRPELLGACVAVFYNPNDPRYKDLAGKKVRVPLYNHEVPFIADAEHVLVDKGTGLVMCCTFGDRTDIIWFTKYQLPFVELIGRDGKMTERAGSLAGLTVKEARAQVIEQLKAADLMRDQKPIMHAVNVHERCKNDIEFLILSQWFLKILPLKSAFIEAGERIIWYPEHMKQRYINWVENLAWDWCLSRQRYFGIPFPVWHCTKCNEFLTPSFDELPIDPQQVKFEGPCTTCGSMDIVPDTDVMDTWNTSSLTPYICKGFFTKDVFGERSLKSFIPMSVRPQAHDIIRTWAFDTIVKVWLHDHTIPFKEIVISGHVLASKGEKLSKSKDNAKTSPQELLKSNAADAIRYWTACSTLGQDFAFSETQIGVGNKLITKLWNAFKFIHIQLGEQKWYTPSLSTAQIEQPVNRWLLYELSQVQQAYHQAFAAHETGLALLRLDRFFWDTFCDNYLELIKDQFFNAEGYSQQQRTETLNTLLHVGLEILQLYAPITPFVTEAIYQQLYKGLLKVPSIHLTQMSIMDCSAYELDAQHLAACIAIVSTVRKLKSEAQLSLKTDIEALELCGTNTLAQQAVERNMQLIRGVTRAKEVTFSTTEAPADSLSDAPHRIIINITSLT